MRCGRRLCKRQERGGDFSYSGCFSRWLRTESGLCVEPNATSGLMLMTFFLLGTSFSTGANHIRHPSCELFSYSFRRSRPSLLCTPSGCGRHFYPAFLGWVVFLQCLSFSYFYYVPCAVIRGFVLTVNCGSYEPRCIFVTR